MDIPFASKIRSSFLYCCLSRLCLHSISVANTLALQTDNDREFDNLAMRTHLAAHGTTLRLSCPYTSSQNGKAKRIIRTLNDCVHSLLLNVGMPRTFWVEALNTATHLINRRPYQSSGSITPYQCLLGRAPDLSHLRVFGCLCYPNQTATTPHKLSARSAPCALLGYPADHRGYRCLDLNNRRVITSRHVVFNEATFPFSSDQFQTTPATARLATVPDSADSPVIIQALTPLNPIHQLVHHPPTPRLHLTCAHYLCYASPHTQHRT